MKRNCKGILSRAFRGKVQLLLSSETVKDKLMSYGAVKFTEQNGKTVWLPQSRSYLIGMESHRILAKFNLEIRGFYNYYCIADNVSATCSKLGYIMQYSLYKTLAQKLNSTMPKIVRKYRKDKEFKIEYTDKKEIKNIVSYTMVDSRKNNLTKWLIVTTCLTLASRNVH